MTEAPRWRLNSAHYLKIPQWLDGSPVVWMQEETSRDTGRMARKMHPVPMLLDPKDPSDCNYPGEIIVTHKVDGARNEPRDLVFLGDPTPEMEALNDAAEAITAVCRDRWEHPIESLPANGGMSPIEQNFMKSMMEAFARSNPLPASAPIPNEEIAALKAELAELRAQMGMVTPKPVPEPAARRA